VEHRRGGRPARGPRARDRPGPGGDPRSPAPAPGVPGPPRGRRRPALLVRRRGRGGPGVRRAQDGRRDRTDSGVAGEPGSGGAPRARSREVRLVTLSLVVHGTAAHLTLERIIREQGATLTPTGRKKGGA